VSISSTFYAHVFRRYPFAKKSQSRTFQLLIFGAKILYEKCVRKMLMKLTEGPLSYILLKLRCDERFTHAFTACGCVFKEITLVGSSQGNYFKNATACSKRTLKTTVTTQLYSLSLCFVLLKWMKKKISIDWPRVFYLKAKLWRLHAQSKFLFNKCFCFLSRFSEDVEKLVWRNGWKIIHLFWQQHLVLRPFSTYTSCRNKNSCYLT